MAQYRADEQTVDICFPVAVRHDYIQVKFISEPEIYILRVSSYYLLDKTDCMAKH
jgi:hypothetical protein